MIRPKSFLYRAVAVAAGLVILSFGLISMRFANGLVYANWFGELVFGPFAIIAGVLIIWGALFKPSILEKPRNFRR
jgi:hypothetical protein